MKKLSLFALLSAAALSLGVHAQTPASPAAAPPAAPAVTAAKTAPAETKPTEAAKPVAAAKHEDESLKDKKAGHPEALKAQHGKKAEHHASAATAATPAVPATPAEPIKK